MNNSKKSKNLTEQERTLGALLRIPYEYLAPRVYTRLTKSGFPEVRPAHGAVFRHIAPEGSRTTELAEKAQMTKQSMGYLVDTLAEHGYLELLPDPEDGRAKLVCLTERGRTAQRKALEISRELERGFAKMIGENEIRQLRSLLEHLVTRLDESEEE